ncbi:MAG: ABC transporter ATP-binding protein [bacterium]
MKLPQKRLIELSSIIKNYPLGDGSLYKALNDINIVINEGEFIAIMGPSGSGKSTLMHIIGVLDSQSSGKYLFKGQEMKNRSDEELAKIRNREIGFVFQSFNLLPRTTVLRNVERPMMYGGIERSQRQSRAIEMLQKLHIEEKADNLANQISGGQIQRVAIARALIMNPSIILADEPTGNLDSKTSNEIMKILSELNRQGKTIVVITHEESIAKFAKRKIYLKDGGIIIDKKIKD